MSQKKQKIASLDVDSQKGFTFACPFELPVPEAEDIVDELNLQAKHVDFRIGSKDAHPAKAIWTADQNHPPFSPLNGKHVDVYWPVHCVPGTKGFELIEGLPHPTEYDYFVWKGIEPDMHPYGACYHDFDDKLSTGLIEFLNSHDVGTVIVGGLATDYCVKTSVLQLLKAGFKVIVNLAACRGIESQTTESAIQQMKQAGAEFVKSSSYLNSLLKD